MPTNHLSGPEGQRSMSPIEPSVTLPSMTALTLTPDKPGLLNLLVHASRVDLSVSSRSVLLTRADISTPESRISLDLQYAPAILLALISNGITRAIRVEASCEIVAYPQITLMDNVLKARLTIFLI